MKFFYKQKCDCGGTYTFEAYGDAHFNPATCSGCGESANLFDPLSISPSAERLIHRSRYEFEDGDYSISILACVMSVEYFLTAQHQKIKKMEFFIINHEFPSSVDMEKWTRDKELRGESSKKLDSICQICTGRGFNDYIRDKGFQNALSSTLHTEPTKYIQQELFERRNRIAHRGFVNSSPEDAQFCLDIACRVLAILREIDKEYSQKYL